MSDLITFLVLVERVFKGLLQQRRHNKTLDSSSLSRKFITISWSSCWLSFHGEDSANFTGSKQSDAIQG